MSQRLTYLERRILQYPDLAVRDVARVEHLTIHEVLEARDTLRSRGLVPTTDRGADAQGLSRADIDHMMRANTAPRSDGEGGSTAIEGEW